jgi:hypothetical protein
MPRSINLVEYSDTPARSRGPPAEFYSRLWRFLLAAPGFYSQFVDIRAFHQSLALWTQPATATRPFKAFALCSCSFCVEGQIKMPFILSHERTKSVKYGSRGTTFIRRCLAASTSSSTQILQPGHGGLRQSSTLAYGDFFSQLQGFIRSVLTYGLLTNHPFSGRNRQLLLVPSKLLPYLVVSPLVNVYHVHSHAVKRFSKFLRS